MSYPPGQQPPTWGPGQPPPTWSQQPPQSWGVPPQQYSVNPGKAGTNPAVIVGVFIGILVLVIGIAAVLIFANQPPPPTAPCQPGVPCAPGGPSLPPIAQASPTPEVAETPGPSAPSTPPATPLPSGQPTSAPGSPAPVETPTSDSPPVVMGGSSWHSESLDFGFEYNGERFELSQSTDEFAVLELPSLDSTVVVRATAEDITPAEMIDRELAFIDGLMIGRTKDTDDYDAVLGPSIGHIRGESAVFSGILTNSNGTPVAPGGVTIMAATNGRLTALIVVIVQQPDAAFGSDTLQYTARFAADSIVKTFDWGDAT